MSSWAVSLISISTRRCSIFTRYSVCKTTKGYFMRISYALAQQAAQYVLHNASVPVISRFAGRIDTHQGVELNITRPDPDRLGYGAGIQFGNPCNVEHFRAGQAQRFSSLPFGILQGQDAHAQQVGAMYAFIGFGNDSPDPKQDRALGRPVA